MAAPDEVSSRQSLLRRLVGWIPLVSLGLVAVIGYRVWTDKLEWSPVTKDHAGFLDFMAEHSPNARQYRSRYLQKFGRESVASRHFEQVCAAMVASAVADNVDPTRYSEPMTRGCKIRGRKYARGELPS